MPSYRCGAVARAGQCCSQTLLSLLRNWVAVGWTYASRLRKCCLFGPTAVPTVGHRASTARVLQCRWQPCGLSRCWPRLLVSSTDWPMLANAGQLMKWAEATQIGWLFGFVLATALATLRRAHRSLDHSTVAHLSASHRDGVCVMVSSAGCALDCRWQKTIRSILR